MTVYPQRERERERESLKKCVSGSGESGHVSDMRLVVLQARGRIIRRRKATYDEG